MYEIGVDINSQYDKLMMRKNVVRIKFEREYLALFTGLSVDYITMWSSDICQMQSKRSVQFYERTDRMYELKNGSARLASALMHIRDDDYTISRLASCLNYLPQQLREDIQALDDCVSMSLQRDRENEEQQAPPTGLAWVFP